MTQVIIPAYRTSSSEKLVATKNVFLDLAKKKGIRNESNPFCYIFFTNFIQLTRR